MAAWEVIPFSFIFDWFVNFGDWLSSLRDGGTDIAQSYASYATTATTTFSSAGSHFIEGDAIVDIVTVNRLTDLSLPTLPLVDPGWANAYRTVDAISLIISFLKRILKTRSR
jgi:hypothetical protein